MSSGERPVLLGRMVFDVVIEFFAELFAEVIEAVLQRIEEGPQDKGCQ